MKMTSGASAATGLRRREQVKEGKQYGQTLPTAEVIMKRGNEKENDKRSPCNDTTQKERASPGREAVQTDAPNSGGQYEKKK